MLALLELNFWVYGPLVVILGIAVILFLILWFRRPLHKARELDASVAETQTKDQAVRNDISRDIENARELLLRAQNQCQSSGQAAQAVEIRRASDALDQLKRLAQQAEAGRIDPLKDKQSGVDKIQRLEAFDRSMREMIKGLFSKAEQVQSRATARQDKELSEDVMVLIEQASELSRRFQERQQIIQG